jgi:hypothetical protein
MEKKYRGFYVDWWQIKRSTVLGGAAIILSLALLSGGGWWLLYRSDFFSAQPEAADAPKDAARVVSFEGDVRIVRAATRETILVTKPTFVSAGDTIQTQADGRAQVEMIDGSTLSIRPNSAVVIRDSQSIFGGTNVRVTLDGGQINVKTQDQTEQTNNVVEVLESENRVFAQTDASFNINEQNGGEIRISRGGVETNVGGERTVVKENEFAAVNNGKIAPKERLLDAPKPVAPANSEQISAASDVSFRWQKPEANSAVGFYLQVSKSPFFVADGIIIERDNLTSQIFTLANLAPGIYYWRLRASSASGQTSDWSEFWKFTITKAAASGTLEATDWQVETVGGNIYLISGKTQPGATVRIQGREVFATANGSFRLQVSAGSPNVTVEISDERGNRSRYGLNLTSARAVRQ